MEPEHGGMFTEDPNWEGQIKAVKQSTETAIAQLVEKTDKLTEIVESNHTHTRDMVAEAIDDLKRSILKGK